jgi:hypothetical protein
MGDVSLATYHWESDTALPIPDFKIDKQCVNWEKLDYWAKSRRFDVFDETALVHPTLGQSI